MLSIASRIDGFLMSYLLRKVGAARPVAIHPQLAQTILIEARQKVFGRLVAVIVTNDFWILMLASSPLLIIADIQDIS